MRGLYLSEQKQRRTGFGGGGVEDEMRGKKGNCGQDVKSMNKFN